jgi:flagellar hook-basal body complex protein FliE
MAVPSIGGVGSKLPLPPISKPSTAEAASPDSFHKLLDNAVGSLNKLQSEADTSSAKLAAGEPVELHEVLLANEQASLAFQLAVQVRNKVVEAYQEVMRMQV